MKKIGIECILIIILVILLASIFSFYPKEEAKKVSLENKIQIIPSKEEGIKIAVSSMISPKETLYMYDDMFDYISKKLGKSVKMVQRKTYAEVNYLLENGDIDAGFICSGAYVQGHTDFGLELLIAPQVDGTREYYAYIIVNKNSNIETFEQLRGKTFAFTDPMSNTGRLIPIYMIGVLGETPKSFFSNYIFTYSHDNSIKAVSDGLVDGASIDGLVWNFYNKTKPEFVEKTKIIKISPRYGIPPVVVSPSINLLTKTRLKEILLNMHNDAEGKNILDKLMIEKFVDIDDSAYSSVKHMRDWLETHNITIW